MDTRSGRICVLHAFRPYLRLLTAFNYEHFRHSSWGQSVSYAICLTVMILFVLVLIILGFWYLIEINAGLRKAVVSLPILFSLLQMEIAFIAMVANNSNILKMIDGIQKVIDQSKFEKEKYFFLILHGMF